MVVVVLSAPALCGRRFNTLPCPRFMRPSPRSSSFRASFQQAARSRYSGDIPQQTARRRFDRAARGSSSDSSSTVFTGGAAAATSACAICLGRHPHRPQECRASSLHYHPSQPTYVKRAPSGRGIVVASTGDPVCLRFNIPKGCDGCSLKHRCSGCGSPSHCAQSCPHGREGAASNSASG